MAPAGQRILGLGGQFSGFVVIEYALLFGLGFLTAILTGLLFAPAIHRRIVKFTENRIMATVPVSPQELRAQKDMVRAEMAVSVARTGHDLKREREKAADLSIKHDVLSQEASRLHGENSDLRTEIDEMTIQAGELRASLRAEEMKLGKMKEALTATQHSEKMKESRIDELLNRLQRLTMDIDTLKIDLATRDTEAESFRARINALRDERETLRSELKVMTTRAKDAELKLAREENRAIRLEDRLNAEVSGSVDKDTVIERRMTEISRLKERLKNANADAREAERGAKGVARPQTITRIRGAANSDVDGRRPAPDLATAPPLAIIRDERVKELIDDVRGQSVAVGDMLVNQNDSTRDEALRNELADIAAKMVAITGQKEGADSPIRTIIGSKQGKGQNNRVSLAERASRLIHQE